MSKRLKGDKRPNKLFIRGIYMLLFLLISYFITTLTILMAITQFISTLFLGRPSRGLLKISRFLNGYASQIDQFLMFLSETKPFPFNAFK